MPERLERLRATIKDLEAELETLDALDAETRSLLHKAVNEIQAAIRKQDPTQIRQGPLSGELTRVAERFETTHPNLYGIVSRIVDALAQMGI